MKHLDNANEATFDAGSFRLARRRQVEHRFFVGAAVSMILVSVLGFAPSLMDQSRRNAPSSPMVIAHGMAVGAWLLLFLMQAILVARNRTSVHRRLGLIAPVLAFAIIVLGIAVLIDFARRGYDLSGDVMRAISRTASSQKNPDVILFPLSELMSFGILVGLAFWFRHRPDVHKRLMLLAAVPILTEPILHFVGHLSLYWPALRGKGVAIAVPVTLFLLCTTALYDRVTQDRIHPATLRASALLFTFQNLFVPVLFLSTTWHKAAAWLIR